jgi:hypothetical protein
MGEIRTEKTRHPLGWLKMGDTLPRTFFFVEWVKDFLNHVFKCCFQPFADKQLNR